MASGTINVYDLSAHGVNVDKAPTFLKDGELRQAQNAVMDVAGHAGGIRKRPGLARFTSSGAGASILGGIGVPLPDYTLTAPTIYLGRQSQNTGMGEDSKGWWKSTDRFATAATEIESGTPANPRGDQVEEWATSTLGAHIGSPAASCVTKNRLIYAADDYSVNEPATIRVFDGTVDRELTQVTIKATGNGTDGYGILSMLAVNDTTVYLTVFASPSAGSVETGYVLKLDPLSGAITEVGTLSLASRHIPYSLCWHMGRLWMGTMGADGSSGQIFWIRPGLDTSWTLDRTMASGQGAACLVSFQGQLFAGTSQDSAGATCIMEVRSSVGAWSASLTLASGEDQSFLAAIVFEANLYTSHYLFTSNQATIRKFDGSSWSTAYSGATVTDVPLALAFLDDTTLYFAGGQGDNAPAALVSTVDGSSWTDRTSNLTNATTPPGMMALSAVGVLRL